MSSIHKRFHYILATLNNNLDTEIDWFGRVVGKMSSSNHYVIQYTSSWSSSTLPQGAPLQYWVRLAEWCWHICMCSSEISADSLLWEPAEVKEWSSESVMPKKIVFGPPRLFYWWWWSHKVSIVSRCLKGIFERWWHWQNLDGLKLEFPYREWLECFLSWKSIFLFLKSAAFLCFLMFYFCFSCLMNPFVWQGKCCLVRMGAV